MGSLVVVNAGGIEAKIIESKYRIFFSRTGLPVSPPYEPSGRVLLIPGTVLDVGESCTVTLSDKVPALEAPTGESEEEAILKGAFGETGWRVYVAGQIRYEDAGGVERFMGFCRERGEDGRFRPVDDADYEYED